MDSEFSRKKALVFGVLLLVFLAIPVTVYTALQQQSASSLAAEVTPTATPSGTLTTTVTPTFTVTPTIDPNASPSACIAPDQVQNVVITCPNCSVTPTP